MGKEIETKKWEGEIPVHYLYTYGLAGEKFFREIKDRATFVATKCDKCNVTYVPPRIYCERCFAELGNYKDVGTKGTVETYTVCRSEIIAVVRLDGTDGGLVHRLSVTDPAKVNIGMKVEAVFADSAKRTGTINDILHFRPV